MRFLPFLLLLLVIDSVAETSSPKQLDRIAFGSCANQDRDQPIWDSVVDFAPDVWIWMGDNVYGDTKDMDLLASKYSKQKKKPGYTTLQKNTQIIGTWDDHDYGINNGGKEFSAKVGSQKALLDFLDEPLDSPRRSQEGVHWSYQYGSGDRMIQIILLDCRYFRDARGSNGDMLGSTQWQWLEQTLTQSEASIHVIVSGIQVLPEDHKYERWAEFPQERDRLLQLTSQNAKGQVIFLSGDRHISEFSQLTQNNRKLIELTSSSLTHSWANFPGEPNHLRVGEVYYDETYGTIEIDWKQRKLDLQIRSETGEVEQSVTVDFAQ